MPTLEPRAWDEKFAILEAPRLFLGDLAHYRARCELKRIPCSEPRLVSNLAARGSVRSFTAVGD